MTRAARKGKELRNAGMTSGDVEAIPAGESADHYVLVKKKNATEAEEEEDRSE
jgi:hypothetical protein